MNKWLPIIIAGMLVLGLRLPAYIIKKRANKTVAELRASGALNQQLNRTSSFSSTPVSPEKKVGQTYSDPDLGFSIVFPAGWTVKEPISSDSIIIKAIRRGENHKLAALNIHAWELDGSVNVAAMSPQELFDLTYADQGVLLDSGIENLNGHRATWMKMKLTAMGVQGYALTYVLAHNNILFSLHGNTMAGDATWFEENRPSILASIRTFKFTR